MNSVTQKNKERVQSIRRKLSLVLAVLEPFLLYEHREEDLDDIYFPIEISDKLKDKIIIQFEPRITLLRNNPKKNSEQVRAFEMDYLLLKGECFVLIEEYE